MNAEIYISAHRTHSFVSLRNSDHIFVSVSITLSEKRNTSNAFFLCCDVFFGFGDGVVFNRFWRLIVISALIQRVLFSSDVIHPTNQIVEHLSAFFCFDILNKFECLSEIDFSGGQFRLMKKKEAMFIFFSVHFS